MHHPPTQSPADPPPRVLARISRICCLALLAAFIYLAIYHLHHQTRAGGTHVGDFSTFYLAAQFAAQHRDIYTAGTSPQMMYVYPPLIAFLFRPLASLSMIHAAQVFLLINTFLLFAAILFSTRAVLRRLAPASPHLFWPVALLATFLSFSQIRSVLTMGETDGIMAFLFALAFDSLDRRPSLAGAALAFAFNIKYLSIAAVPYLLIRRRWTALASMAVATVALALLPALELGSHENLRDLRVASQGLLLWVGVPPETSHAIRVHDIADDLSVSVTSAVARLLAPHGFSNKMILAVTATIAASMLALLWRQYHQNHLPLWQWPPRREQTNSPYSQLVALEWPTLVAMVLVFSPDTNTRHLVMALLLNTLAAALLVTSPQRTNHPAIITATAMILFALLMPLGREFPALGAFYYRYSIPTCGLALGALLLIAATLPAIGSSNSTASRSATVV